MVYGCPSFSGTVQDLIVPNFHENPTKSHGWLRGGGGGLNWFPQFIGHVRCVKMMNKNSLGNSGQIIVTFPAGWSLHLKLWWISGRESTQNAQNIRGWVDWWKLIQWNERFHHFVNISGDFERFGVKDISEIQNHNIRKFLQVSFSTS